MNPFSPILFDEHYADLHQKSGLSDSKIKTVCDTGFRSLTLTQARKLKFPIPKGVKTTLRITYPGTKFSRIKLFPPSGKQKYSQKKGSGVHLFVPPGNDPRLYDPNVPLFIVEGEKKALKGSQEGMCCVAIGGIWCWWDKRNIRVR